MPFEKKESGFSEAMEQSERKNKKGFAVGKTVLPHGLMLAPMAGVTDATFRALCRECGAEYTVTEMISAKALFYGDKKTAVLAAVDRAEMPCAVQIFGADTECMAYAARLLSDAAVTPCGTLPAAIDVNMGCPMPKIAGNGDGSALMRDPVLAGNIIEAVRNATELPVTVKIRTGWDAAHKNCVEIAKIAASLGVSAIVVHGRTRAQLYAPPVDRDSIRAVRQAVPDAVPVIGNGDIYTAADALSMMAETECDGVMVARGTNGNPWIFSEIASAMDGVPYTPPTQTEKLTFALSHLRRLIAAKGTHTGLVEGRKHIAWYIRGLPGSAAVRQAVMTADNPETVERLLTVLFEAKEE